MTAPEKAITETLARNGVESLADRYPPSILARAIRIAAAAGMLRAETIVRIAALISRPSVGRWS